MTQPELTNAIGHTYEPQHTARLLPPLQVRPAVAEFLEGLAIRADHFQRHPTEEKWPARQAVEIEVATGDGPVRVRVMRGTLLEAAKPSEAHAVEMPVFNLDGGRLPWDPHQPEAAEAKGWRADAEMYRSSLEHLRPFVVGSVGGDRLEPEQLPTWIIPQLKAGQKSNMALETLRVFVGGPGLAACGSSDLADLAIQQLEELRAERRACVAHFAGPHDIAVGELPSHVAKLEAEAEDAVLFMRHIAIALDLNYTAAPTELITAATSAMRRARGASAHVAILAQAIRESKPAPRSVREAVFDGVVRPFGRWLEGVARGEA